MANLKLVAQLGLDKTGFDAGIASAGKQAEKFGNNLKNSLAGAFALSAITAFTSNLIQSVSHVNDLSERLGVSAEALQAMKYAAEQSGSSLETVAGSFRALSKARLEAMQDPNSKAGQVFSAMGIGEAEVKASSLEGLFRRIAQTIQTTDFGASELAVVEELLGRSAGELIPMFKAGLEQATQEAVRLGLVIDEGVVQKIDDAGDAFDRMATRLKSAVAPAVGFVSEKIQDMIDLLDMVVGGAGTMAGGLMNGSSFKDAAQMAADHVEEVLDNRIKAETKAKEKADRSRSGFPINQEAARVAKDFSFKGSDKKTDNEKEKANRGFSVTETSFGRIGAFTGASAGAAISPAQMQQIQKLDKLAEIMQTRGILIRDVR